MTFKSKAENLDAIRKDKNFKKYLQVPEFFFFKKKDLKKNKFKIYNFIKKKHCIFRSSSQNEDKVNISNAGFYDSFILKKNSSKKIIDEKLLKISLKLKNNDFILIQRFIFSVNYSGVIFSSDYRTNSPYISIEYDKSGKTNYITSGKKLVELKTIIYKKNFLKKRKFSTIQKIVLKLEKKFNSNRIDIEFAVKGKTFYLFQIRPLPNPYNKSQENLKSSLVNIEKKIKKLKKKKHDLYGSDTIFSNMSDWNPAEIIGNKPSPLAISLYKEIITNTVWAKQRYNYGYKDCHPNVLMFDFLGSPYIDLRTDLNSFLPKSLDAEISNKTINYCIKKLKNNKYLHDKIEFELIETCFTPDTFLKLNEFLSKKDAKNYTGLLLNLTNNIVLQKKLNHDLQQIRDFEIDLVNIKNTNYSSIEKIFKYIYLLKNKGALAFAGIARCAFISKSILDYLHKKTLITDKNYSNFFKSLDTISNKLNSDLYFLTKKNITKKDFLKKYGHIRPSMYDINAKNYSEGFDQYFDLKVIKETKKYENYEIKLAISEKEFKSLGYKFSRSDFLEFCKLSIANRENSKNSFSKGINLIFNELKKLSKELNINQKNLSLIDIDLILNSHSKLKSIKLAKEIKDNIFDNKQNVEILNNLNLPDIIINSDDVYNFDSLVIKENFVTEKMINGNLLHLNNPKSFKKILKNKIVLIESADPGFDFIFSRNIKGFITAFGGANSHMSIRALEQDIPAVIGVGIDKFNKLKNSKKITIDCKNKKIFN